MKTMVVILGLMLFGTFGASAQKVIELKEAKVSLEPSAVLVKSNLNELVYVIKDNGLVSFAENPLEFMKRNFNIHDVIDAVKDEKYDSYVVTFKSTKGNLNASFDKKGDLQRTYCKLDNILLPREIRNKMFLDYPGWTMTKNSHVTGSNRNVVTKDFYRINLENGNKNQKIKIDSYLTGQGVVSN
ncbi:MAG: hypothetical protein WCD31_11240 [Gillisia sp.]